MTRRLLAMVAVAVAVLGASGGATRGQTTFTYNFGTSAALTGAPTATTGAGASSGAFTVGNSYGTVSNPITAGSASSGYTGSSAGGNIGNAVNTRDNDPTNGTLNTATSPYFSVTITPSAGSALTLTKFDFGARSTGTGAQAYSILSSADNFAAVVATGTITANSTWGLKTNAITFAPAAGFSAATEFRVYTYGGAGNAATSTINTRLDDVVITVVPVPEPASVVAATSLALAAVGGLRRRKLAAA